MIVSLKTAVFGRKKTTIPFKDYYTEWFDILKNSLLPQLRLSLSQPSSSLLSTHVESIHHHYQSYYDALDLAASEDVAQVLFPEWRSSLERPFLWFGDLHPCVFINLLRSFLEDGDTEEDEEMDDESTVLESRELFDKPWRVATAWKSPSEDLTTKIEQIERGLRLMVPAVVVRGRKAQEEFIERVSSEWMSCERRKEGTKEAVAEAMADEMEELTSVFMDANRLRRSVLTDILSATSVYQAALFLEGLSEFLVGFRDQGLRSQFERCKMLCS